MVISIEKAIKIYSNIAGKGCALTSAKIRIRTPDKNSKVWAPIAASVSLFKKEIPLSCIKYDLILKYNLFARSDLFVFKIYRVFFLKESHPVKQASE